VIACLPHVATPGGEGEEAARTLAHAALRQETPVHVAACLDERTTFAAERAGKLIQGKRLRAHPRAPDEERCAELCAGEARRQQPFAP
jgi:hypothetical protein